MKKIFRVIISFVICVVILNESTKLVMSDEIVLNKTAYYPINQTSEEWQSLSYTQQIESCRIEKEYLDCMSTDELIDCVLAHPLIGDVLCFDNANDALNYLRKISDAYVELEERIDCHIRLQKRIDDVSEYGYSFVEEAALRLMAGNEVGEFETQNAEPGIRGLMSGFNGNQGSLHSETVNGRTIYYISGSYTLYNKTESAYQYYSNDFTSAQIASMDQSMLSSHPTWTKLGSATGKYNCHSYAWVSTNMSTNIWRVTGCTNFASSTSFTYIGANMPAQAGDIIRIGNTHSMIVTSGGVSSSTIKVKSKLGFDGVYITSVSDMKTMYATAGANYYVYRP